MKYLPLTSNDAHVIALARVSGARILFCRDTALEKDFRNPSVINNPRGKIYKYKSHKNLLGVQPSCPYDRKKG